jgi:hypothetical protein
MTRQEQVKGQARTARQVLSCEQDRLRVKETAGCSSRSGVYFSLSPFGFHLGFLA